MKQQPAFDFYEIQKKQQRKSYVLIGILFLFYFFAVGLISLVFFLSIGLIFLDPSRLFSTTIPNFMMGNVILSGLIAFFHFFEARKFGAKFILKRILAQKPDPSDRHHKRFMNTLEEMSIASGLPKVHPFIIPGSAINSMALIKANGEPCVIVTEGLLAELTRDELQAVIAHELGHIIRGDSFYLTLVCSLANLFERVRQRLEPDEIPAGGAFPDYQGQGQAVLAYSAVTFSSFIMHILSTLINRERETLADAAAVEISRNPRALARAIYKAHMRNSFVGDFNLTYSPLFIVPPESKGISEGFFSRIFSSHPPLMKRIGLLADMAHIKKESLIDEVWNIQKDREEARQVHPAFEEHQPETAFSLLEKAASAKEDGKIWLVRNPKEIWEGPFSLKEALFLRYFTPLVPMRNLQENITASANEFPQIREALRGIRKQKPLDPSKHNHCPRCRIPLNDSYYEGVAIKACSQCKGRLVESSLMDRIIARKEIAFSEALIDKAQDFKAMFMSDPVYSRKSRSGKLPPLFCPNCGGKMLPRPYNYHLVIPVDKCLLCNQIWFDSDELEILQILIENP
jgi:heat shock protein HtpX